MKPDVPVELKALRLHGMAGARPNLVEQGGNAGIGTSRRLIELGSAPTRTWLRRSRQRTACQMSSAGDAGESAAPAAALTNQREPSANGDRTVPRAPLPARKSKGLAPCGS